MKKIFNISLVTALMIVGVACDSGFEELNTNKTALTTVNPMFLLNRATLSTSYTTGFAGGSVIIYEMPIVQQLTSPLQGVVSGGNFNRENRQATSSLWQNYYPNVIRHTKEAIDIAQNQLNRGNLVNMSRIIQAYAFMVLTDTYGDIPYYEAGLGYPELILYPKYNTQEEVYTNIIQELEEASAALDPDGQIEVLDILYKGDIAKWKKFGYSLLLRAGMRLSKVNPTKAASVVQTALQGGVMTTNEDNAIIRHDDNFRNATGNTLNSTEAGNFYLAAPFVDHLKNTNDPRLSSIAVRYVGATTPADQQKAVGATTDPDDQVGLPIGSGDLNYGNYSQLDRTRMGHFWAPVFLVTAAQTQLLLAEAAHNTWIAGNEEEYYNNGVLLHMGQLASYHAGSAVDPDDAQAYLQENPFDANNALEQINTQYWIASLLNGPEAFANFRRSGFPDLDPNPAEGQEIPAGTFIRRLLYPTSEISINPNLSSEMKNNDKLSSRVWWDAQ